MRRGGRRVEVGGRLVERRGSAPARGRRARARSAAAGRRRRGGPARRRRCRGPPAASRSNRGRPRGRARRAVLRRRRPARATRRFSRIVVANRCASWPERSTVARTSSCRYSRRSRPSRSTRPPSGSRKRTRQWASVVLPAPLAPVSATVRPPRSSRSMPAKTPSTASDSTRSIDSRRRGGGRVRVADGRLAVDELEQALGRRLGRPEVLGGDRQRPDRLERGER